MSAFKHFDVDRYLEDAKSEAKTRHLAKPAKAAKDGHGNGQPLAALAGLAGARAESSSLDGSPEGRSGVATTATFPDPFNTETQLKDAADSPAPSKKWAAAAARLRRMNRPATVGEDRWQQVRSDATRLLDWASMLVAMDWTVEDVYGRDEIDRQSLAWKVKGQRIGPTTSTAVTLRGTDGSTTWVYRRVET